jgi:hypothetical protein
MGLCVKEKGVGWIRNVQDGSLAEFPFGRRDSPLIVTLVRIRRVLLRGSIQRFPKTIP